MKKFQAVSLLAILCTVMILLSSCSDNNYGLNKKDTVMLVVWNYYNGAQQQAFDKIVSEFNETVGRDTGIIVEAFSQGSISQLYEKLYNSAEKAVGSDEMPDIFAAYSDTAYLIDKMGLIADIGQYLTEEEQNQYIDSYIEEGRIGMGGELKIFPIAKSTELLMLNKTDWDKFALATGSDTERFNTWEGIAEVAKEYYEWTDSLTIDENDGKAFFGRDAVANYILVGTAQLGSELFQVDKDEVHVNINTDAFRRIWDNYYVPFINGYYGEFGRFRSDDLKTGDIICYVGSTSGAMYFPKNVAKNDTDTYEIEVQVFPVPSFEGTEKYIVQQGAGFAITKSNEKKEYAATVFLKYFTDTNTNIRFSASSGYLPVKKEANDISLIKEVVQHTEDEYAQNILDKSLTVALGEIKTHKLYSTKPFNNGNEARNFIENSLILKASADLKDIEQLMESGMPKEEAIKNFDTDENFNTWILNFEKELNSIVK